MPTLAGRMPFPLPSPFSTWTPVWGTDGESGRWGGARLRYQIALNPLVVKLVPQYFVNVQDLAFVLTVPLSCVIRRNRWV